MNDLEHRPQNIDDLIKTLTPLQVLRLGAVMTAHESRLWFRTKVREAEAYKREATRNRCGSWLASVGSYYDSLDQEADRLLSQARINSISMDKFYKKKRHEFTDAGGTHAQLDQLVAILTKEQK